MLKWSFKKIPYWAYAFVLFVLVVNTCYIIARLKVPFDGLAYKIENYQYFISKFWYNSPAGNAGWFYFIVYSLVLIVSITSLYILYRKPFDFAARIFFIYLQLLAIALNFRLLFLLGAFNLFVSISFIFSFNLLGVVLFHFNLIFPEPSSFYKKYKNLLKITYTIAVLTGITGAFLLIRSIYDSSSEATMAYGNFIRWSMRWMGVTSLAAFAFAVYQFITIKRSLVRKQLRLVVIGMAFGLSFPIIYSIFPGFFLKLELAQQKPWLEFMSTTATFIMTTFLAFAIFRYRIWNVEPVIRKTIFYSGISAGIYFFYLGLVLLTKRLVIHQSDLVNYLSLMASIIVFLLLKDIIQRTIDRLFHREPYDSASVLKEFEEKLTGVYKIDLLEDIIVQGLNDIFHFKSFVFAVRLDNLSYKPARLSGLDSCLTDKEFEITHEVETLLLKTSVFAIEALSRIPEFFKISQGEFIVSLMKENHPYGFFVVGPKMSEKSYSLQDIRVLSLLANRIVSQFQTANLYQKDLDRQLMLERERTRIARDVHDDVGANLTRISILSELVKNNLSDPIVIRPWLQQISETSQNVILDMAQIIWALNPKNDILEGLIAYIRRFALEYLETGPVKCTFDLPAELPALQLSGEVRRNVYLCIREALHNVVKHADASNILISLKMNGHGFIITIKDDGKGFDASNPSICGNGLINMEKRIKGVGGELFIRTAERKGTEISFVVPIHVNNGIN